MVYKVYNEIEILVDAKDLPLVNQYSWHVKTGKGKSYVVNTYFYKGKTLARWMHRLITNAPRDMEVDHINGNGLDNRRSNLRLCTRQQNAFNRDKDKDNKAGFKGVHKSKYGRYIAQIQFNGEKLYLGSFGSAKEAHEAYKRKSMDLFGEYSFHIKGRAL